MFYERHFSTWNVNSIKKMHTKEKKKYSTSIENHCVVEKQLSVSFELFVTSVLPFVHFLNRAKKQNGTGVTSENICLHCANRVSRTFQNDITDTRVPQC